MEVRRDLAHFLKIERCDFFAPKNQQIREHHTTKHHNNTHDNQLYGMMGGCKGDGKSVGDSGSALSI
jgi:hypothetical protein